MTIYNSTKVLPYVYQLTHKETGQFYIGVRFANKVPSSDDLGLKYFTCSNYVKELGFENFDLIIIAEFFNKKDAYEYEQQEIRKYWHMNKCLNKCYGALKFKDAPPISEETRQKLQKPKSKEAKQNMRIAALNKLPASAETRKNLSKAALGKKYSNEHCQAISKGLINKPKSETHRENLSKAALKRQFKKQLSIQCPHCEKIGGSHNMKRYHFDNCKFKTKEF